MLSSVERFTRKGTNVGHAVESFKSFTRSSRVPGDASREWKAGRKEERKEGRKDGA